MLRLLPALLLLALTARATPPTVPGHLVFKLNPGQTPAAVERALQALNATQLTQKFPRAVAPSRERPGGVELRGIYEITVPGGVPLAQARRVLLGSGAVEYVEPLYTRKPMYQPNDPLADSTLAVAQSGQVYLKQIHAYRAWDVAPGDTTLVIGITDGGIRLTHEDLRGQVKHNYADPVNGRDDDNDGYVDNFTGWDLANHDNNAGFDATLIHGSYVAGVAAARVGNGRGIAGLGNRCKFMPLNIYPNTPTGQFAGFEAVAYAADHGCQVINMSWGAAGGYSRFEQDVCTYAAVNRDAVLVAAAGNTNRDLRFYPASYDHVVSVTGVFNNDVKGTGFTFNHRIDLAAPGAAILTTLGEGTLYTYGPVDADYQAVSGTSFAAPLVAGAAALVRQRFPAYTAAQVAAQLRQTADDIYQLPGNANYLGKLGTGRLNVARAVGQANRREARVVASVFSPARPTFGAGQLVALHDTVLNLLQPVTNLVVTLTSTSPYLTVVQGTAAVGSLGTLARAATTATPFALRVAATGVPLNAPATLHYHLTADNGMQADDYLDVVLNPDYVTLDANHLDVCLSSRSKLAYDDLFGTIGTGLSYRGSAALLSEGGLLVATSPTRVSDRLRTRNNLIRESFFGASVITRQAPGPRADQEARTVFQDSVPAAGAAARSVGVRVRHRALAWAAPAARRDFVLLEYTLTNLTPDTLRPLYAGLFADWDLPGDPGRNVATYDSARALGYAYSLGQPAPPLYAGIQWLRGGQPAVYSIDNNAPASSPVRPNDTNGFSPAEKFLALSSGTARATRTAGLPAGTDVAQVVGLKLPFLAPGDSAAVSFAVVVAPTLPALQAAAAAAQQVYAPVVSASRAALPPGFALFPNPTAGPLHLRVPASFGLTDICLLDALGRAVRRSTAPDLNLAGLPAGLYTLRASGTAGTVARTVEVR